MLVGLAPMAVDVAESAVGHGGRDTKAAATARAAVVTVMVTQVVAAMGVATVVVAMDQVQQRVRGRCDSQRDHVKYLSDYAATRCRNC